MSCAALATTNALELGVDISGLDAVLIAGWPGTRVSLWQQAGRAGRAAPTGLVMLVAREDPLDTYLVHHPEALIGVPVEATVFDPTNPYVLAPHLCAAAAERPLRPRTCRCSGPDARAAGRAGGPGALRRRDSGWYWTHAEPARRLTDLRGTGGEPVRVVEEGTGRLLGTVDAASADARSTTARSTCTRAAPTWSSTWTWSLGRLRPRARRRPPDLGALAEHRRDPRGARESARAGPITWWYGTVDTTTQVIGYTRRRVPDLAASAARCSTCHRARCAPRAVWWTAPLEVLAEPRSSTTGRRPGALHAAEHASIGLLPLLATCDRWDLGGLSTALHADTACATVFVHDAYPGGAGFAERGFQLGARWLTATRDAIAACACEAGCPACVQSPKCGNGNEPLDKAGALRLLDAVLSSVEPAAGGRRPAAGARSLAAPITSALTRRLAPRGSGSGRGRRRPRSRAANHDGHDAVTSHVAGREDPVVALGHLARPDRNAVSWSATASGREHEAIAAGRPPRRRRAPRGPQPRARPGSPPARAPESRAPPATVITTRQHGQHEDGARPRRRSAPARRHGSTHAVADEPTGSGPDGEPAARGRRCHLHLDPRRAAPHPNLAPGSTCSTRRDHLARRRARAPRAGRRSGPPPPCAAGARPPRA